ncbi:MAG: hypothetical protein A3G59_03160 [Candidatus Taylorbacteria bacterium RIFCSPLOWO2_12_FULL_47_20]|uniref:Transcriptional repressor PaaX-like central Cas2-like domain-containing protein n=2 Tax=Candidatus Tayloriibacteriota TaxID=1817919 RepID=A0A1G2PB68_9BACT|nr:MAG: hypothetical protein A3H68_03530 [Candidatus Taylorbacteria bacterium RIFCSPLOWO2_02_FULL_46_40]OHA45586.1 MAG: hypothetical protein A3G59_03160 [Candidatus Taylorbacteria bacterium RIFCSPLOWO2_12_FULL_47_20]
MQGKTRARVIIRDENEKKISTRITRFLRQEKIGGIQKVVLGIVGLAGIITVAMIAPNAVQAFEKLGIIPGKRKKEQIKQSYKKLLSSGLLEQDENGLVRLTSKGENRMTQLGIMGKKMTRSQKWDGQWRVLIFDIPEKKRGLRDKIRLTLTAMGFKHLQHSVWIHPYDCANLISLLKSDFKIGKELIYIITDKIEYDNELRKFFGV